MTLSIYQVDAFHDQVFRGNPAAVCPLENWLPDELMQSIALENNLSETAFFVKTGQEVFEIRWFTPKCEVDLCGHATLASAHVIFSYLEFEENTVRFKSKSGDLYVTKNGNGLMNMDFPSYKPERINFDYTYEEAFGIRPVAAWKGNYLLLEFEDEKNVITVSPDFQRIRTLDPVGVIITARGKKYDFVSRFFAPMMGINEDPVTGSAHSLLTPFWSGKLDKRKMIAYQCSERGGLLYCEDRGERVTIGGNAITYMTGKIHIND